MADAFGVQLHDLVLIPPRGIFKTSSGKIQRRRTGAAIAAGELTILARWTAQLPTQPQSGDSKPSQDLTSLLLGWIREAVSLSLPDSALQDVPFRELGLDSASAVTMMGMVA